MSPQVELTFLILKGMTVFQSWWWIQIQPGCDASYVFPWIQFSAKCQTKTSPHLSFVYRVFDFCACLNEYEQRPTYSHIHWRFLVSFWTTRELIQTLIWNNPNTKLLLGSWLFTFLMHHSNHSVAYFWWYWLDDDAGHVSNYSFGDDGITADVKF